jgi:hypothetical protein
MATTTTSSSTSYSYSSDSSSSFSTSSSASSEVSELDELFYTSMCMSDRDKIRLGREFYTPEPISLSGNYYPRSKVTGDMQTGTSHVSYLPRPYYSYNVNSRYNGFSKYVYVRKN